MNKSKLSQYIICINIFLLIQIHAVLSDELAGTIKDAATHTPLSGVVIWLEGTNF